MAIDSSSAVFWNYDRNHSTPNTKSAHRNFVKVITNWNKTLVWFISDKLMTSAAVFWWTKFISFYLGSEQSWGRLQHSG